MLIRNREFMYDEVGVIRNREFTFDEGDDTLNVLPCFSGLRLLAVWQANNAHWTLKIYNCFGYVLFLATTISLIYLLVTTQKETWSLALNTLSTLSVMGIPFLYLKWYQHCGNYEEMMTNIKVNNRKRYYYCKYISSCYTVAAFLLWIFGSSTNILVFLNLLNHNFWFYIVYITIILYAMGWWACWLTIYGFICHIHITEITQCRKDITQMSSMNALPFADILNKCKTLKMNLSESQKLFHIVISLAVFLHLIDIAVYTVSYFEGDFKKTVGVFKYPVVCFILGITVDVLSISMKLLPAAKVSSALHDLTLAVSDLCVPTTSGVFNEKLFMLYQYIYIAEQDMGYKIMGVKISMRLTASLFIAFISLLGSLFKFLLPSSAGSSNRISVFARLF